MKKVLAISSWWLCLPVLCFAVLCFTVPSPTVFGQLPGQTAPSAQDNPATAGAMGQTGSTATGLSSGVVYRDPRTGLLYQQEVRTVDQPVTTMQRKMVERTVVTPQTVLENQQVPHTIYVPTTEYVLQSKLKGWWNPLAQPTYAYEYMPVTRYVPQTQMVSRQVPTVKMTSKVEQVPIDEPVQTTQKVTQVTWRPLTAPAGSLPGARIPANTNPVGAVALSGGTYPTTALSYPAPQATWSAPNAMRAPTQPLIASVPVLANTNAANWQPGPLLTAPVNGLRNVMRTATAPFRSPTSTYGTYGSSGSFGTPASYSNKAAPTTIASQPNSSIWSRDLNQTGMQPTVIR